MRWILSGAALAAAALVCTSASALPLSVAQLPKPALVAALQRGGYVLVMRHASSPAARPSAAEAEPGNHGRERQLDARGKAAATAMGRAIRRLNIRIGKVWSSPTFRALQTARLAGLPRPQIAPEVGDNGASMSAATAGQSAWLKAHAARAPAPGRDNVIVTQQPNIAGAFPEAAQGLGDGEALVFQPQAGAIAHLVGRIPMPEWPQLAAGRTRHELDRPAPRP